MTIQPENEDAIEQLIEVMKRLRSPEGGCPWDLEQTFETIAPYTIEEAYEVSDAINRGDINDIKEELGDLLLQVVFHSQIADEAGHFSIQEVAATIVKKMIHRHPHVFKKTGERTSQEQSAAWEEIKAAERMSNSAQGVRSSALDGVAIALPALLRAEKLQKRAARVGFDWTETNRIFDKLNEEIDEVKEAIETSNKSEIVDEIGDLIFVCANLARKLDIKPEEALRQANSKFERRFRGMEKMAAQNRQEFSELELDQQEALWNAVKKTETSPAEQ